MFLIPQVDVCLLPLSIWIDKFVASLSQPLNVCDHGVAIDLTCCQCVTSIHLEGHICYCSVVTDTFVATVVFLLILHTCFQCLTNICRQSQVSCHYYDKVNFLCHCGFPCAATVQNLMVMCWHRVSSVLEVAHFGKGNLDTLQLKSLK